MNKDRLLRALEVDFLLFFFTNDGQDSSLYKCQTMDWTALLTVEILDFKSHEV